MGFQLLWLVAMAIGLAWWVRNDARRFRRFVEIEDSAVRRAWFRRWIAESFVILTGCAAVTLWLAGATGNPFRFPDALAGGGMGTGGGIGFRYGAWLSGAMIGLAFAVAASAIVQLVRSRHPSAPASAPRPPQPVAAMMPRNAREMLLMVPLSLNAGFSEELLFRLALPLLLVQLAGSLWIAVGLATIGFGLAHLYQGWAGVIATGAVGLVLALVYLSSQSLIGVMALHAGIDLVALVVRPAVAMGIERLAPARRMG